MKSDVKHVYKVHTSLFVEQPEGYLVKGKEYKVYCLCKALYGLKQASRAWNSKIDMYFHENGFHWKKQSEQDFLIACVYVDDLIYIGTNLKMVENFKMTMMEEYDMRPRPMKYFLGIQVRYKRLAKEIQYVKLQVDGYSNGSEMKSCN